MNVWNGERSCARLAAKPMDERQGKPPCRLCPPTSAHHDIDRGVVVVMSMAPMMMVMVVFGNLKTVGGPILGLIDGGEHRLGIWNGIEKLGIGLSLEHDRRIGGARRRSAGQ